MAASWLTAVAIGEQAGGSRHLFYVPVVLAAARFGLPTVTATGIAATLLAGPFSVAAPLSVWVIRGPFFVGIGLLVRSLIVIMQASATDAALRELTVTLQEQVRERTGELQDSLRQLRRTDEQRRRLVDSLVRAQEVERRRIASDMHDESVQAITALTLRLGMLRQRVHDEELRSQLSALEDSAGDAIHMLRSLVFQLRPIALEQQGLIAALEELRIHYEEDWEVVWRLEDGLCDAPPEEVAIVLYRIAQEALTNVRKHAHADHVTITVADKDGGVLLRVRDDGVGFDPAQTMRPHPGHLGLFSIRERAELAGGTASLISTPGEGTTVEAWVPARPPVQDSGGGWV